MKVLWKIALLLVIVLIVFFILDDNIQENKPLESPVKPGIAIPLPGKAEDTSINSSSRPEIGLSTFVGKDITNLIGAMGNPDRIEPSAFNYEWWIYKGDFQFMVGVNNEKVNQIYSADSYSDITPFVIGGDVKDVYRTTIIESEVNVLLGENSYSFTLNSDDMNNRLLIQYEGLYAQLYIDSEGQDIEGVRFIDAKTLVAHQPYDMAYMGEMVVVNRPSSTMQIEVDRAMERQLFELTNQYRRNYGVKALRTDYTLSTIAQKHSQDMALENYFSHDSPKLGNYAERLKEANLSHNKAGENLAFDYVDAIEAVHGWFNSPIHRKVLVDKDFTHLGTGVYGRYYTQDFIYKIYDDTVEEK